MAVTLKSIAILLHDFNAGGTEATALRLAAEWIAAGHRVTIIAGAADGPMRERVPAGADVHLLSPPVPRSALSRLRLGVQRYAVFSHAGHITEIQSVWRTIWSEWVPQKVKMPADAPFFERYPEAFDPQTGDGGFDIWLPLSRP